MAENIRTVRLSHQKLSELAAMYEDSTQKTSQEDSPKVGPGKNSSRPSSKRPERALYQPSSRRENTGEPKHRKHTADPADMEHITDDMRDMNMMDDQRNSDGKRRPKRPDLARYRPRGVQADGRSPQEGPPATKDRDSNSPDAERMVKAMGAESMTVTVTRGGVEDGSRGAARIDEAGGERDGSWQGRKKAEDQEGRRGGGRRRNDGEDRRGGRGGRSGDDGWGRDEGRGKADMKGDNREESKGRRDGGGGRGQRDGYDDQRREGGRGRGRGGRGRGRGRGSRESTPKDDQSQSQKSEQNLQTEGKKRGGGKGRGGRIEPTTHDSSFDLEWDYQIEESLLGAKLNTESVDAPVLETAEFEMSFSDDDLQDLAEEGGRKPRTESLNWGDIVDMEEMQQKLEEEAGSQGDELEDGDGPKADVDASAQPPREQRKRSRKRKKGKKKEEEAGSPVTPEQGEDAQQMVPKESKRYSQRKYVQSDSGLKLDGGPPRVTENTQVASEVDKGKFEGMVFTNSRFDGKGRDPERPRPSSAGAGQWNRPMSGNDMQRNRQRHSSGESQESWGGGGRRGWQPHDDSWGGAGGRRGGAGRRNSQENQDAWGSGGRRGRRNSGSVRNSNDRFEGSDDGRYDKNRKNRSGSADFLDDGAFPRDDRYPGTRGGSLKRYGKSRHGSGEMDGLRGPGDTKSLDRRGKNKRRGNRSRSGSVELLDDPRYPRNSSGPQRRGGSDKRAGSEDYDSHRGGGGGRGAMDRRRKQSNSSDGGYHDYDDIPRYKEEFKNKEDQLGDGRRGGLLHLPASVMRGSQSPGPHVPNRSPTSPNSPGQNPPPYPLMMIPTGRGGYMGPGPGPGPAMGRGGYLMQNIRGGLGPGAGGAGRGRGGVAGRTLYDPNNPHKPLPQQQQQPQQQPPQQHPQQQAYPPPQHFQAPAAGRGQPFQQDQYYVPNYFQGEQAKMYFDQITAEYGPGGTFSNMMQGYGVDREQYQNYHGMGPPPQASMSPSVITSGSSDKQKAARLLQDVTPLDSQLANLLSRRIYGEEGFQKILTLRREVQNQYEQMLLLDPDMASDHNVEQLLWKSTYYQVIELFRGRIADDEGDDDDAGSGEYAKKYLHNLLEEGTSFYESLLSGLEKRQGFQLESYLDPNQAPEEKPARRGLKLALLSAQRCLICLGDIARYKEQLNGTCNYGVARNWYMKAQQIAPKNGRPYNQLAILALYTKHKLDAVYYYMRSLSATNPFLTARESLMSLFDEARKKMEAADKKKLEDQRSKQPDARQGQGRRGQNEGRVEIWIHPDGSKDRVTDGAEGDSVDLGKLSPTELNKKFVLSFLNCHGKLFTKIGMERFPDVCSEMLQVFSALVSHSPAPVSNFRLLQLMAINMFAIDNTQPTEDLGDCRSVVQDHAIALGLDMFAILAARCTTLFVEHLNSNSCQILDADLRALYPSVKVWSDWMMCHVALWNPPPMQRDPLLGPDINVWKSVADLCNELKEVDISYVKLYSQKKEGCELVTLSEDAIMAGFVPLLSLPDMPQYVHATVDKEVARDCLRVQKLGTFGDYLCGIDPPLLSYNVQTHRYESIDVATEGQQEQGNVNRQHSKADSDDVIVESDAEDEDESDQHNTSGEGAEIRQLKAKKSQLEKQVKQQKEHEDNIQAVLNENSGVRLEIRVTPMFLVPDTNCFIDHLDAIKKVLQSKKFTVVVPLIVINELDGLAKGSREGQYDSADHAAMVHRSATTTVHYLEAEFARRNPHLKAITAKGTTMNTITYRSEEPHDEGSSNDDVILSCCLHYCQDKARDFMPKGKAEPVHLTREVVLLTEDRNLRLKAHMRNVPVKPLPAFLRWANLVT